MTKEEALAKIRALRDEINNTPEDWSNHPVWLLDQAADLIEDELAKQKR